MLMRIAIAALFIATSAVAAAPRASEGVDAAATDPNCFDVAVVARLVRSTPTPLPAQNDPNVIVIRWPWHLDLIVEKALFGSEHRKRVRVTASLHSEFNPEISYFLFFLKRGSDATYIATGIETRLSLDRRGRFVLPVASPHDEYVAEHHTLLKPIDTRAGSAWWLKDEDANMADVQWTEKRGRGLIARYGFFLADLVPAIAAMPGAVCTSRRQ